MPRRERASNDTLASFSFSPGAMYVNVASAFTGVAFGDNELPPDNVAFTVPPVGVPSSLLRGAARMLNCVDGSTPERFAGSDVGSSFTHAPPFHTSATYSA